MIVSNKLSYNYRMFKVEGGDNPESTKDRVMEEMTNYLQNNNGKLINVKIINKKVFCYFVIDC